MCLVTLGAFPACALLTKWARVQEEIDRTPLYANAKWVVRKDGSPEAIEITYLTFYAHNGYYDIGYLGLLKVGAHDGDWEHLTVRLDASTGALQVATHYIRLAGLLGSQ